MSGSSLSIQKSTRASAAGLDSTSPVAVLQLALNVAQGQGAPPLEVTRRVAARAQQLGTLAPDTIRAHLEQVLLGTAVQDALQWLHDAGILPVVLPELEATVDFTQEMGRRHKDVWEHTKQVVAQSKCKPTVRWAALLHDVGKVPTRAVTPEGKVTFHGHAEVGARMFDRIARRLAFPKVQRAQIRWLILHHLRINQYDGSWTDAAVRRFYRQMGDHLDDLFLLSRADITSGRRQKRDHARQMLQQLARRVELVRELDSRQPPLPPGLGNEIMLRFSLEPGRRVGELRRELEQAIERGELLAGQDGAYYLDYLERSAAAPSNGQGAASGARDE